MFKLPSRSFGLMLGVALAIPTTVCAQTQVADWDELNAALGNGQSVEMSTDITVGGSLPSISAGLTFDGGFNMLNGVGNRGFSVGNSLDVTIKNVTANDFSVFLNNGGTVNLVDSKVMSSTFGAVNNFGTLNINNSTFEGNGYMGNGGAISNSGNLVIKDTSFTSNFAQDLEEYNPLDDVTTATQSYGGAIYSSSNVEIIAETRDVNFMDNHVKRYLLPVENNDIYMKNSTLKLTAKDHNISLNSGVNGEDYGITIEGNIYSEYDEDLEKDVYKMSPGVVSISGGILGYPDVHFNSGTWAFTVGETAEINNLTFGPEIEGFSPVMQISIDPRADTAGPIMAIGDIQGTVKVVLNVLSEAGQGYSAAFLEAPNDDLTTQTDISISRVINSPYMWKVVHIVTGPEEDRKGSVWAAELDDGTAPVDPPKPDPEDPDNPGGGTGRPTRPDPNVTPEILTYLGLPSAAVEQHRNMVGTIRNKVAANKFPSRSGRIYEDHFKGTSQFNAWVNPVYVYSTMKNVAEWDATIYGGEMGIDVQGNEYDKLGIFGSYRQGRYEFTGKGDVYSSPLESDLTLKSFMAGLYYRHDRNNFWTFSTIFAGNQNATFKTQDDVIDTTSKGTQWGGSFEMGYAFMPGTSVTLEPTLGVFYTGLDFDKVEDHFGKTADYDVFHYGEIEFGIKLEKTFDVGYGFTKIYIKPSVIQTVVEGNKAKITGLGQVETYDNETLGKLELGGRMALNNQLSAYGNVSYTAGSDYDNLMGSLGVSYRW